MFNSEFAKNYISIIFTILLLAYFALYTYSFINLKKVIKESKKKEEKVKSDKTNKKSKSQKVPDSKGELTEKNKGNQENKSKNQSSDKGVNKTFIQELFSSLKKREAIISFLDKGSPKENKSSIRKNT